MGSVGFCFLSNSVTLSKWVEPVPWKLSTTSHRNRPIKLPKIESIAR